MYPYPPHGTLYMRVRENAKINYIVGKPGVSSEDLYVLNYVMQKPSTYRTSHQASIIGEEMAVLM